MKLGVSWNILKQTDNAPYWERSESHPAVGCPLEHAPINYFLAAVVATRTLWSTAMALFYFDRYSEDMLGKLLVIIGIASGGILTVILNTTTPASAGAFGILSVFIFTYLLIVSVMTYALYGISHMLALTSKLFNSGTSTDTMRFQRAYYYATIVSLAPVIIISLQSVGGVGIYELGLILLLVLLGCIYVTKRTAR